MGFKMKGSPAKLGTISGTAGHSSALKMKAEADAASALKQLSAETLEKYGGGKSSDIVASEEYKKDMGVAEKEVKTKKEAPKLTKHGTKTYKTAYEGLEDTPGGGKKDKWGRTYKSQKEFNKASDDWWASEAGQKRASAKGSKFAHRIIKKEAPVTKDKTELTKTEKVIAKGDKKIGEVKENVSKKTTKIAKKEARKEFGRGSKEHLEAKKAHLEAKATDIKGGKGGRKRGLFTGLATKINLKRQKKTQEKIDAAKKAERETPAKQLKHPKVGGRTSEEWVSSKRKARRTKKMEKMEKPEKKETKKEEVRKEWVKPK